MDTSPYHRKLADALWKRCWLLAGEADKTFIDKHDFAAALTAEGVVDIATIHDCMRCDRLEQQLTDAEDRCRLLTEQWGIVGKQLASSKARNEELAGELADLRAEIGDLGRQLAAGIKT